MLIYNNLLSLISISIFRIEVSSDSVCPNATAVFDGTAEDIIGIWYFYSARPFLFDQDAKCIFINITQVDGNFYVTQTSIRTSTNELKVFYGNVSFGSKPGEIIINYIHPIQYSTTRQYLGGVKNGATAYYTCNPCDSLGAYNEGVHPYILTRIRKPNCTVTDRVIEIFDSFNISTDLMQQIEQDGCII